MWKLIIINWIKLIICACTITDIKIFFLLFRYTLFFVLYPLGVAVSCFHAFVLVSFILNTYLIRFICTENIYHYSLLKQPKILITGIPAGVIFLAPLIYARVCSRERLSEPFGLLENIEWYTQSIIVSRPKPVASLLHCSCLTLHVLVTMFILNLLIYHPK
jgi:Protein tyrosine phosphatase-like protein, PTPLA